MLKKTIKYTDYNGIEREETFWFNLSKAEIADMELSSKGGMQAYIQAIIDEQDNKELVRLFKEVILKSYGKKSIDGKRFEKSEELSKEFSETEAYVELYMELVGDANKAAEFINAVVPKELAEQAKIVEMQSKTVANLEKIDEAAKP